MFLRSLCIATCIFSSSPAFGSVNALIGNTLECVTTDRNDWRSVSLIYLNSGSMFIQDASKEMKTGKIHYGGKAVGQLYHWNKRHAGTVDKVHFRSSATKTADEISYEIQYTVHGTLSDNVTMTVRTSGRIYRKGSTWRLFKDEKQSIAGGGTPAVPRLRSNYDCILKTGRHLN